MKRFIMIVSLVSAFIAMQAQDRYVIEGTIKNVPEGTFVQLFRNIGDILKVVDGDTITGNRFRFSGETTGNGVEPMTLFAMKGDTVSMVLDVYVRPGSHINISGDGMLVYTWDVESDIPEQQTRQKIVMAARKWWDRIQLIDIHVDALRSMMRSGTLADGDKAAVQAKLDSLDKDKCMAVDSVIMAETAVMDGMEVDDAWMEELNGNAIFAKSYDNEKGMNAVRELYDRLPDKWKNTMTGSEIGITVYPPKEIAKGETAADGDLFDIDGGVHHLADFKGKYILLDFWSIGCGPCLQAIPEMKEVAEAYKDSLVIVSLSLDTKEIWKQESPKHGMTWYNLNDLKGRSGIAAKYGVWGIPHYVLVSPQGTMTTQWSGYSKGNLKENVKKHLGGR